MLIEIAKGVDLQKDMLDQMEFRPLISENLRETPVCVYQEGAFGLGKYLKDQ